MFKSKITLFILILNLCWTWSLPAHADTFFKSDNNCVRSYTYRNRSFSIDSSRKLDGEGLRKVFKQVPQSESLLNDYQSNKKISNIPAYTGTIGFLSAAIGEIYASSLTYPGKRDTRYVTILGGLGLLFGSYIFGKLLIKKNENTLGEAVNTYNRLSIPTEQIRVSLEPMANPDGGQIKTIVPFTF